MGSCGCARAGAPLQRGSLTCANAHAPAAALALAPILHQESRVEVTLPLPMAPHVMMPIPTPWQVRHPSWGLLPLLHPGVGACRYIATSADDHRYHLPRSLQEFKVLCSGARKPLTLVALLQELRHEPTIVFASSLETTHKWVVQALPAFCTGRVGALPTTLAPCLLAALVSTAQLHGPHPLPCSLLLQPQLAASAPRRAALAASTCIVEAHAHCSCNVIEHEGCGLPHGDGRALVAR